MFFILKVSKLNDDINVSETDDSFINVIKVMNINVIIMNINITVNTNVIMI